MSQVKYYKKQNLPKTISFLSLPQRTTKLARDSKPFLPRINLKTINNNTLNFQLASNEDNKYIQYEAKLKNFTLKKYQTSCGLMQVNKASVINLPRAQGKDQETNSVAGKNGFSGVKLYSKKNSSFLKYISTSKSTKAYKKFNDNMINLSDKASYSKVRKRTKELADSSNGCKSNYNSNNFSEYSIHDCNSDLNFFYDYTKAKDKESLNSSTICDSPFMIINSNKNKKRQNIFLTKLSNYKATKNKFNTNNHNRACVYNDNFLNNNSNKNKINFKKCNISNTNNKNKIKHKLKITCHNKNNYNNYNNKNNKNNFYNSSNTSLPFIDYNCNNKFSKSTTEGGSQHKKIYKNPRKSSIHFNVSNKTVIVFEASPKGLIRSENLRDLSVKNFFCKNQRIKLANKNNLINKFINDSDNENINKSDFNLMKGKKEILSYQSTEETSSFIPNIINPLLKFGLYTNKKIAKSSNKGLNLSANSQEKNLIHNKKKLFDKKLFYKKLILDKRCHVKNSSSFLLHNKQKSNIENIKKSSAYKTSTENIIGNVKFENEYSNPIDSNNNTHSIKDKYNSISSNTTSIQKPSYRADTLLNSSIYNNKSNNNDNNNTAKKSKKYADEATSTSDIEASSFYNNLQKDIFRENIFDKQKHLQKAFPSSSSVTRLQDNYYSKKKYSLIQKSKKPKAQSNASNGLLMESDFIIKNRIILPKIKTTYSSELEEDSRSNLKTISNYNFSTQVSKIIDNKSASCKPNALLASKKIKTLEKMLDIKDDLLPIISNSNHFISIPNGANKHDVNCYSEKFTFDIDKADERNLYKLLSSTKNFNSGLMKPNYAINIINKNTSNIANKPDSNINNKIIPNSDTNQSHMEVITVNENYYITKNKKSYNNDFEYAANKKPSMHNKLINNPLASINEFAGNNEANKALDGFFSKNEIISTLNLKANKADNSDILSEINKAKKLIANFIEINIDNLISDAYIDDRFKVFDFKLKSKYDYRVAKEFLFFYFLNFKANQKIRVKKLGRKEAKYTNPQTQNTDKIFTTKNFAFEFFLSDNKHFIKDIIDFNNIIKLILAKIGKDISFLINFFNNINPTNLIAMSIDNFFISFYTIKSDNIFIDNKLISILIDFISNAKEKKFYFENFFQLKKIPNEDIKEFTQQVFFNHFYFLKNYLKAVLEISHDLVIELKLSLHISESELSNVLTNDEAKIDLMSRDQEFRVRISSIYFTLVNSLI